MKNQFQLLLRSEEGEVQIEDFDLDQFFPPLAAGQRLELPKNGGVYRVRDSTVEILQQTEIGVMRFSTVLYVERVRPDDGRSF